MSRFPEAPVSPSVFFEEVVPALFAELELAAELSALELKVGVVLEAESAGDEGGAWTLQLAGGELGIRAGRDEACDVSLVQNVRDWRAALWEGRPRLVSDAVGLLKSTEPEALRALREANRPGNPEALRELAEMRGLIEVVISGADDAEDDWRLGILIGPGAIPDVAQATVSLGAAEAEAMRSGLLHPVEALITGQLRLEGDFGLIIRLQAVAMAAALPDPPRG